PVHSSSITVCICKSAPNSKPDSLIAFTAYIIAATPDFMSHIPRPYILLSITVGQYGSVSHICSGSTLSTSTCPCKIKLLPVFKPLDLFSSTTTGRFSQSQFGSP